MRSFLEPQHKGDDRSSRIWHDGLEIATGPRSSILRDRTFESISLQRESTANSASEQQSGYFADRIIPIKAAAHPRYVLFFRFSHLASVEWRRRGEGGSRHFQE